jgi:hypothetical protein
VKKLGKPVIQKYLQSFTMALLRKVAVISASKERIGLKFFIVSSLLKRGTAAKLFRYPCLPFQPRAIFSQLQGVKGI